MSGFETSLLLSGVLAVLAGLFIYWFTAWLDRREERRRHHAAE
jgi:hypothetical protein